MPAKPPSQAMATRYLKAAIAAGVQVREVVVEPDGRLRILAGGGNEPAELSALEQWRASREAR
jgi:hypothetical protein